MKRGGDSGTQVEKGRIASGLAQFSVALRSVTENRRRLLGFLVIVALWATAIVVPILSPFDTDALVGGPNMPPSAQHLFGTDALGRDLLVRSAAGLRIDLVITFLAVALSFISGQIIGVAIGWVRNRAVDAIATRIIDAVLAIPFVILVLTLAVVIGPDFAIPGLPAGVPRLLLATWLVGWAAYARLARAETLAIRDREFVLAARLLGYPRRQVFFRHFFPNVMPASLTYAVSQAVSVVVTVASLAFLGVGIPEPGAELGSIIYENRYMLATAWWIPVIPGVIVVVMGMALTLIADSFADQR